MIPVESTSDLPTLPPPTRRRAVAISGAAVVAQQPLFQDRPGPWLLKPRAEGLNLVDWSRQHLSELESLLNQHRALLLRGFHMPDVKQFQQFALATSHGGLLEYKDRSTPRPEVEGRVYVTTVYPAQKSIDFHNEGTYWKVWARKIYFGCLAAPPRGGQTPIADVRGVYRRIDPVIRSEFEAKQILYVRNYNDGFGLSWQEVFQTQEPADVEQYCRANAIEWEWKPGGRLRTKQRRPAVRLHPLTGERLWFNHGAFFHISSHEESVRKVLLEGLGEENLPFNTYFGCGTPIPDDYVTQIRDAYRAERLLFDWQAGDVLYLDNMTFAHARKPYEGPRQIVVAMTEACSEG